YDKVDFTKQTNKFDIIFDAVGKTNKQECKHLLSEKGEYKSVNGSGYASETLQQLQLLKKLFEKGKFKVGDKVFGMTGFNFGTYAEYIAINQDSNVLEMPRNATFDDAVSLIFGGQTAIYFLKKAKIAEMSNPKILIIGATGSVGTGAIQIARYHKADITVVCSSEGFELVKSLGVYNVILYDKVDFTKQTNKFDIIFDAVGKTNKQECKHLLKEKGEYKSVDGSGYASETLKQLQLLKKLFEKGKFKAVIDKVFPMDKIVEAHRYVDTGRKKGNVVLRISK
ncbi:MAG: NAD(P)-dependent alcohol dehydrogenase, partial [Prolixibacteraceae bacterium]|nr:NAD(P)-dependent alcohol dehydrogenase [Prolixibacteraceae bacterium]